MRIEEMGIGIVVTLMVGRLFSAEPWTKEPTGYRGVRWGTRETEAVQMIREADAQLPGADHRIATVDCKGNRYFGVAVRACQRHFTLAGSVAHLPPLRFALPVAKTACEDTMIFHEGSLVAVTWGFDSSSFETIEAVMIEKYGQPTAPRVSRRLQNAFGAEYLDETLEWRGRAVSVTLSRYGADLKHSSVLFITESFAAIANRTKGEEIKKAKDAF